MEQEAIVRPGRHDARFVVLCLLVILVGAVVGKLGFFRAFPEASIDFKVTRDEARRRAERALAERGFDTKGFRALVSFDGDDEAKTFLERTLGLAKANPLFGGTVPVWRWSVRFVKPLEKLEYRAFVAPSGELLSFRRLLPEKQAAPDPGDDAARAMAGETVRAMRGLDPGALRFVESTVERRPARVDRTYVWESRTVRFGDAALRYLVEVQGDRVGRSSVFFEVPQQWRQEYRTLRSKNEAAGALATFGLLLTAVAALVVAVERLRRRDVRWRVALGFGAVGAGLQLLSGLNELPTRLFDYATSESWGGFLFRCVSGVVGGALLLGIVLVLLVAAGEPLFRESYPGLPALGRLFSRRALGTRRFFRGLLLGYALTAAFLAYQVVFYIVAERLGAWAPADVPYSSLLGTAFPWLGVLVMGFYPATTEEFSSRMLSIPLLSRVLPVPLAVVLPALVWGFAHSAYPNQPFFIRGVELAVVGTVIGFVMLREGLLPLLVWHFTVDALYTALLLLRSTSTYFVVSGALSAFVLLLPLLAAAFLAWRRGGFLPEEELTNASAGSAPAVARAPEPVPAAFAPPSTPVRALAAAFVAAGAVLLAASLVLPRLRLEGEYALSRSEAVAAADRLLAAQGEDPHGYLRVPVTGAGLPEYDENGESDLVPYLWSDDAALWLVRHGGVPALTRWAGSVLPGAVWQVRYVRSLDEHGAWVALDARSGRLAGLKRTFPDGEKGAQLDAAAARAKADALVRAAGEDPSRFVVVAQQAIEKKARRDHRLVYQSSEVAAGGAPLRIAVELAGDAPALVARAIQLPEEWVRARDRTTGTTIAGVALKVLGVATLAALALVELIRAARRGVVPWRRLVGPAALCALPTLLLQAVSLPLALRGFRPEFSFGVFSVFIAIAEVVGVAAAFGIAYVALAFVAAARPDAFAAFRRGVPGGGRAIACALGVAFTVVGAARFGSTIAAAFPFLAAFEGLGAPPGADTLLPLATVLVAAVQRALLLGGAAALAALLLHDFLRPWPMRIGALVLFAGAFAPLSPRTPEELLVPWFASLLAGAALFAGVAVLLRDDPRAYVAVAALLAAVRGGWSLLASDLGWWRVNGVLTFALVFSVIAVLAVRSGPVPGGVGTKTE